MSPRDVLRWQSRPGVYKIGYGPHRVLRDENHPLRKWLTTLVAAEERAASHRNRPLAHQCFSQTGRCGRSTAGDLTQPLLITLFTRYRPPTTSRDAALATISARGR